MKFHMGYSGDDVVHKIPYALAESAENVGIDLMQNHL